MNVRVIIQINRVRDIIRDISGNRVCGRNSLAREKVATNLIFVSINDGWIVERV